MESALPARVERPDPRTLLGPKLWRAHEQASIRTEPTGFSALDRALPGGGWPLGAVSEVLHAQPGVGFEQGAVCAADDAVAGGVQVGVLAPRQRRAVVRAAVGPDAHGIAAAHGEHEKRSGGQHDEEWPDWYAEYMVREQVGKLSS